jgi:hypothetical protein
VNTITKVCWTLASDFSDRAPNQLTRVTLSPSTKGVLTSNVYDYCFYDTSLGVINSIIVCLLVIILKYSVPGASSRIFWNLCGGLLYIVKKISFQSKHRMKEKNLCCSNCINLPIYGVNCNPKFETSSLLYRAMGLTPLLSAQ